VRIVPVALLVLAAAVAGGIVLSGDDDRYRVTLELANAGGLRNGANVRVAGAPAGRVTSVRVGKGDRAVAELRLEPEVAPIGQGARALVDTDGIFGERFVQIDRGDLSRPRPSGTLIGVRDSGVSVRLDDVVDALDLDTSQALQSFLNEQGTALVGRGRDLADVLAALPSGLDRTGELLDQFAADNRALGQLVDASDRVVAGVARERYQLGRLVGGFGDTLETLDSRRGQLGETVRRAPGTLRSARRALVSLDGAAHPLIGAARGLRSTAPALKGTLEELPRFADEAVPSLRTAARLAPELQTLGRRATPVVRELRPMARVLSDYTRRGLDPFSDLLDKGAPDIFGVMEGWARSTQGRDAASHIFRFGASSGSDTVAGLLAPPAERRKRRPARPAPSRDIPAPSVTPKLPPVKVPKLPVLPDGVADALNRALEKPGEAVGKTLDDVTGQAERTEPLLDFLLGP